MNILELNIDDFKEAIQKLTFKQKTELLYHVIDKMEDIDKVKSLLETGANPKKELYDVTIWSFAFARDLANKDHNKYFPVILPYVFLNFEDDFIARSMQYVNSAIREYKVITKRSGMIINTLGYEPEEIKSKLDKQYNDVLETMCIEIEKIHYEIVERLNNEKELKLEAEKETKKPKLKLIK